MDYSTPVPLTCEYQQIAKTSRGRAGVLGGMDSNTAPRAQNYPASTTTILLPSFAASAWDHDIRTSVPFPTLASADHEN